VTRLIWINAYCDAWIFGNEFLLRKGGHRSEQSPVFASDRVEMRSASVFD
jgi:hypothetical protein